MQRRSWILIVVVLLTLAAIMGITTIGVVYAIFGGGKESVSGHNIAIIEVEGIIFESQPFIKRLDELLEEKDIKAIVVRVDSPGGVVAPCQEIYEALLEAKKKKRVVISLGSVAASGGYYIAAAGEKIVSSPGTLTGSIGVIMNFTNLQGLYQWAKVDPFTIKSGQFKDIGTPSRPMTEQEKEILQTTISDIYQQFRKAVKDGRNLNDSELDKIADGRIFSGHQALEHKLVDELGGLQTAINSAAALAKIKGKPKVLYPPEPKQSFLKLLTSLQDHLDLASTQLHSLVAQGPMFLWSK